jgi:hypothetical protein
MPKPDHDMMDIRMAAPSEDEILVGHYLKIWDIYGTPPEHYRGRALVSHQTTLLDNE